MKRIIKFLDCLAIFICLVSCANNSSDDSGNTTDNIVSTFASGTTIWEGTNEFYADENGKWVCENMWFQYVGIKAGDQIQITHIENTEHPVPETYEWTGLQLAGLFSDWEDMKNRCCDGECINASIPNKDKENGDNLYFGCTMMPYSKNQTTAYTFTQEDADVINAYGGFILWGCGYTIKKIVIVSDGIRAISGYQLYDNNSIVDYYDKTQNVLRIYSGKASYYASIEKSYINNPDQDPSEITKIQARWKSANNNMTVTDFVRTFFTEIKLSSPVWNEHTNGKVTYDKFSSENITIEKCYLSLESKDGFKEIKWNDGGVEKSLFTKREIINVVGSIVGEFLNNGGTPVIRYTSLPSEPSFLKECINEGGDGYEYTWY